MKRITTPRGEGFQISTPERTWLFVSPLEEKERVNTWVAHLTRIIDDTKRRRERECVIMGQQTVKSGWACLKDVDGGVAFEDESEGGWARRWLQLSSEAKLLIFTSAPSALGAVSARVPDYSIDLSSLVSVRRSRGVDFYSCCIDIVGQETMLRMQLQDKSEMRGWLAVLQRTPALRSRLDAGSGTTIEPIRGGWLQKLPRKGDKLAIGEGWRWRFFVLAAQVSPQGQRIYRLHYFRSEQETQNMFESGDFLELELLVSIFSTAATGSGAQCGITLVTPDRRWYLRADSQSNQELWIDAIRSVSMAEDRLQASSVATPCFRDRVREALKSTFGAMGIRFKSLESSKYAELAASENLTSPATIKFSSTRSANMCDAHTLEATSVERRGKAHAPPGRRGGAVPHTLQLPGMRLPAEMGLPEASTDGLLQQGAVLALSSKQISSAWKGSKTATEAMTRKGLAVRSEALLRMDQLQSIRL